MSVQPFQKNVVGHSVNAGLHLPSDSAHRLASTSRPTKGLSNSAWCAATTIELEDNSHKVSGILRRANSRKGP